MEAILRRRRTLKGRLTRIENAIGDQVITPRTAATYRPQVSQLRTELELIHNEVGPLCDDAAFEFQLGEYNGLINRMEAIGNRFPEEATANVTAAVNNAAPTAAANIRLPRLDLPTFNGNFYEWSSFYDLFSATIVSNELLTGAQRLQYLKTSLRGEPAALIQSLQVTDDNFTEAWQILQNRYHNRREIINAHLKRLCSQPVITSESPTALRRLIDTTNETVRALRVLDTPVDQWDIILVHIIAERLDVDSRRQWELSLTDTEVVKYADFISFLEQRARALVTCGQLRTKVSGRPPDRKPLNASSHHVNTSRMSCKICKDNHPSYKCNELLESSVEDRKTIVRSHKLCYNCLAHDHQWSQCRAGGCRKCGAKHHTLLHPAQQSTTTLHKESTEDQASLHSSQTQDHQQPTRVLLATALIKIKDAHGNNQVCRALLDSGSQATFISEDCAQRLGLQRAKARVSVTGLSETSVSISRGLVKLCITSCVNPSAKLNTDALVLHKVTSTMPVIAYDRLSWSHIPSRKLADPFFHVPKRVDILFGADILAEVLRQGLRRGPTNTPVAQESTLGWLVSGKTRSTSLVAPISVNMAQIDLNTSVQRFWELEDSLTATPLTEEQRKCEEHFLSSHQRSPSGRFIVRLPFKKTEFLVDPAESRQHAVKRLYQLERRLDKDPERLAEYSDFLQEYLSLQHMKLITNETDKAESVFLPHHAVIKESSSTTRVRVVFDASAKCNNGTSLNDHLLIGPPVQDDMFTILLRFRIHAIVFTADIQKMYRQIQIHNEDTKFQNIVWRENPTQPIQDYRLLTLTYGTASAPYLATRCLKQLAKDESQEFPKAAATIGSDFYVDDLISGASTVQDAVTLQAQVTTVLHRGGFELHKWTSNSEDFLKALPVDKRFQHSSRCLDPDETVKTLGLRWMPASDNFTFDLKLDQQVIVNTKRTLLSTIAKIFDPMGWLAPTTIKAKLLLQALWRTPCAWDDPLPKSINDEWTSFLQELDHIKELRIPRRLFDTEALCYQLHGFCDASERAYAAAMYLQITRTDGTVEVKLIAAKTRVAPLKFVSLPRLELCGALLLARLQEPVREALSMSIADTYAWTDSTIVLAWIKAESSRWKTFVANRVSEVQDKLPASQWHHVQGLDNPVDCASRGLSPAELKGHPLWWNGPKWLQQPFSPQDEPTQELTIEQEPSEKRIVHGLLTRIPEPEPLISRYSSLTRLVRITAYLFRFIHNCRVPKEQRRLTFLSSEELNQAELHWIKAVQREEFAPELHCLINKQPLPSKSKLITLNPFLDAVGVLRVGGRLRHAMTKVDRKFPILLPRKHDFTTLVVRHEHERNLHAGPQLLLASILQRFWIICGRDVTRQFVRKCIVCFRQRSSSPRPTMGDLPVARANPGRPFLRSGVDYAGPLTMRVMKGRGRQTYKAYIALFVCLSTHAIHLELVSDLTTAAFIAALKRFMARRGLCSDLYSDQGTNFIGANQELKSCLKFTSTQEHKETVAQHLSNNGIKWHFNPPAAPHFGGLWEAGVKSVKSHLRRVVGNVTLNFEELYTVLTQIEACLNSRPLCPLSSNPNDLGALTPGHFLIGETLTALAEPDFTETPMNRLSRWQLLQRLTQHFWNRWSREYLVRLQQRPKSWTSSNDIKLHDLVLLKDEKLPPTRWQLGRVQQVHPGKDGIVRVVTITTASGEYRRPVVRVCKLPLDPE